MDGGEEFGGEWRGGGDFEVEVEEYEGFVDEQEGCEPDLGGCVGEISVCEEGGFFEGFGGVEGGFFYSVLHVYYGCFD